MHQRIGVRNPIYVNETWVTVRDYTSFIAVIEKMGNPKVISFDHDLAEAHYDPELMQESFGYLEETGYDCAKWYVDYIRKTKQECAEIFVHSMNPAGTANIESLFKQIK